MAPDSENSGFEGILGDKGVFVVAEIGKNYIQTEEDQPVETYIQNAVELIDAAVDAGADAVKFQTHELEDEQLNIEVVSPHFDAQDRYSWVKRNTESTPMEFWKAIKKHCEDRGILFFTTPMSRNAARKVEPLDLTLWKVGSGDVQDYVLLNHLLKTGKSIVISTGMVSLGELDEVVHYLKDGGAPLAVLYCISHYPCPPEEFNLATIGYLKEKYPDVIIGFSDHSIGHDAALAAVKLGARIVEKHFSMSRDLWGSDHKASMTPTELRAMVDAIRSKAYEDVDEAKFLGVPDKELEGATNPYRPYFNKKLVAGQDLKKGAVLQEDMIYAMRPAKEIEGLEANRLSEVLGKTIAKDLKKYDPIAPNALL